MKNIAILIPLLFALQSTKAQENLSTLEKLTQELNTINQQGPIKGFSVAIVNKDTILYNKGFGFSNVSKQTPYTKNTIQPIASISKTFIGIALLKAQELGNLTLDDPINKYLPFKVINPNFPNNPITIRHLATHTSSIKDPKEYESKNYILNNRNTENTKPNKNFLSLDKEISHANYLKNILSKNGAWYKKKTFSKTVPGSMFNYSNIGAGLAAFILEKATGKSFSSFTKEHIFSPLKMMQSGWHISDVDKLTHTKLYHADGKELSPYHLINYPDGGLITSTENLAYYLIELLNGYHNNGSLLKKMSFKEVFTQQLSAKNYTKRKLNTYSDEYNSGIFMGFSSKGQVGHTGGDPAVITFMFFNPKKNIGKILFCNTNVKKDGIQQLIKIWNTLIKHEDQF